MQTIIHHVAHKSINIVVDNEERRGGFLICVWPVRPSSQPTSHPFLIRILSTCGHTWLAGRANFKWLSGWGAWEWNVELNLKYFYLSLRCLQFMKKELLFNLSSWSQKWGMSRFFLFIDDVSENYRPRSLGWVGTLKNKRDEGGTLSRQWSIRGKVAWWKRIGRSIINLSQHILVINPELVSSRETEKD